MRQIEHGGGRVLIKTLIDAEMEKSFQASVAARLGELLQGAPKTIKLSKLCEDFAEHGRTWDESRQGDTWSLRYEKMFPDSDILKDHWRLGLDEDDGKKIRDCEVQLELKTLRDPAKLAELGLADDGNSFVLEKLVLDGKDVATRLFFGPEYGFAKECWQMYAAGTILVFDDSPDDIDTEYPYSE